MIVQVREIPINSNFPEYRQARPEFIAISERTRDVKGFLLQMLFMSVETELALIRRERSEIA